MIFQISGNQIHPLSFRDKGSAHTLNLLSLHWFELTTKNGEIISDKNFQLLKKSVIESISLQKRSERYDDHLRVKIIKATFTTKHQN